jgi:hypothetical protein
MASPTTDAGAVGHAKTLAVVLLIGVAGFAVGSLFTAIGVVLLSTVGIAVTERPTVLIVVSVVTVQGLGFGSVALFYLWRRDEGFDLLMLGIPGLKDLIWIAAGLVALFVALIGISLLQTVFGIETAQHGLIELGARTPELLLVMVPLSILLVGPGEELLFRGIIQQLLRIRFGVAIGITVASVIFAVAHVGALTGDGLIATLITYVVLSVILGVSYEYSGNLVVPAVIHGLFNAIQFVGLYWVITRGTEPLLLVL